MFKGNVLRYWLAVSYCYYSLILPFTVLPVRSHCPSLRHIDEIWPWTALFTNMVIKIRFNFLLFSLVIQTPFFPATTGASEGRCKDPGMWQHLIPGIPDRNRGRALLRYHPHARAAKTCGSRNSSRHGCAVTQPGPGAQKSLPGSCITGECTKCP